MHTYAKPGKDKIVIYESAEHLYPDANNYQWTNIKPTLKWEAKDFDPFILNSANQIEYTTNPLLSTILPSKTSTAIIADNDTWKMEHSWLFIAIQNLTANPIEVYISLKGVVKCYCRVCGDRVDS